MHTSLDVIDEKGAIELEKAATSQRSCAVNVNKKIFSNPSGDLYLGLLFSVEDFKVYGYVTNTKIKFVVVLKDLVGDTHVRSVSVRFKAMCSYLNCALLSVVP